MAQLASRHSDTIGAAIHIFANPGRFLHLASQLLPWLSGWSRICSLRREGSIAVERPERRLRAILVADVAGYLREHRPPVLVVWGRNDPLFTVAGANAYKRDATNAEVHLLDGGHYALEEHAETAASLIREFLSRRVVRD